MIRREPKNPRNPLEWDIIGTDRFGRAIRRMKLDVRIAKFTRQEGECLVWTGSTNENGYGNLSANGESLAHRVVYSLKHGPITSGMLICHTCDNPSCVRLDHLFIGTPLDNTRDMMKKGRDVHLCGEASGKAKLTADEVSLIRAMRANGHKHDDIAKRFGVSASHVSRLTRGARRMFDGGPLTPKFDQSQKANCLHGHPIDGVRPNGHRYCKTCRRLYQRKRTTDSMHLRAIPTRDRTHCPKGHPLDGVIKNGPRAGCRYCLTCNRTRNPEKANAMGLHLFRGDAGRRAA